MMLQTRHSHTEADMEDTDRIVIIKSMLSMTRNMVINIINNDVWREII